MVRNSVQIDMTRFYVDSKYIGEKEVSITDADDIHHYIKVLRAKKGDEAVVSDGVRYEYRCRIKEISKKEIVLEIIDKNEFHSEPAIKVTLYQGVPKGAKMDDCIRKCIELGVYSIVPVMTDRVDVSDNKTGNMKNRLVRWRKISREAAKQSQRGIVPEIREFINNEELYEELKDYDLVVWPYEQEKQTTIKERLRSIDKRPETLAIVIGPEGGFSDAEADSLKQYQSVSIGKSILRTETAGLVTLAMVMYELEL